jgi:hypothetical protein
VTVPYSKQENAGPGLKAKNNSGEMNRFQKFLMFYTQIRGDLREGTQMGLMIKISPDHNHLKNLRSCLLPYNSPKVMARVLQDLGKK